MLEETSDIVHRNQAADNADWIKVTNVHAEGARWSRAVAESSKTSRTTASLVTEPGIAYRLRNRP